MSAMIIVLVIFAVFMAYVGIVSYGHWILTLDYKENIGGYFTFADQASDAKTKAGYFNQYVEAIEKAGLTKGCNSVYFCEQPNSKMEDKYKVLKSLQIRLNELSKLQETETAYQLGMTQMTENEFCWFPQNSFLQHYALQHGYWGMAISPPDTYNICD